jgi:hypothetical protein
MRATRMSGRVDLRDLRAQYPVAIRCSAGSADAAFGPGDWGRPTLPRRSWPGNAGGMTTRTLSPNGTASVVLPAGTAPAVVPITRGTGDSARTIGVVLIDPAGARWQRTADVERLVTVATATAGLAAVAGFVAAALRRPTARVDRLTMGPGGWVSFKGGEKPRPRGPRRPWWAVLLRARPLGE